MKKHVMKTILDEDLESVLRRLNLLNAVLGGQSCCAVCGRPVTRQNIQFIIPTGPNSATFVCDLSACVQEFLDRSSGGPNEL